MSSLFLKGCPGSGLEGRTEGEGLEGRCSVGGGLRVCGTSDGGGAGEKRPAVGFTVRGRAW